MVQLHRPHSPLLVSRLAGESCGSLTVTTVWGHVVNPTPETLNVVMQHGHKPDDCNALHFLYSSSTVLADKCAGLAMYALRIDV